MTRWITVPAERIARWLGGFAERHGEASYAASGEEVVVTAADGARAECRVPFPPLDVDAAAPFGGLVAHANAERTVGVLLVRLGGFAAGVFEGPRLLTSKVGSRPVHGRSAAGGWSQKRFARRRELQSRTALDAAADAAAAILLPAAADLHAVVTGGDRRAVEQVLRDPRLVALLPLLSATLADVPDPTRAVLAGSHERFSAVRIRVSEPE
jgi:hypothetical protein